MSEDEDQVDLKTHKQLLHAISSLGKTQHIKKSTRDEPKLQQDEFQLVKGKAVVEKEQPVLVRDVVQVLKDTSKHVKTGNQMKVVLDTSKILGKPLEKPAAERIKRTIGYENIKKKLNRWDAVVTKNRSSETQVFPLKGETIYVNTSKNEVLQQAVKSDLMLQMEELESKYAQLKREQIGDTDDPKELREREKELLKNKMTKEELIAKRKELAYLKMRESQKSAKARLQNKIKSKKYHKLLKRQKMQEQIKEFELLQKTNPEAALEKLNALEKSRLLERATLRHKNTGTWAKNLQVRAKYDKDVRKDLSEQLQISRQLTQKSADSDNEDDENMQVETTTVSWERVEDMEYDPFNPWTKVGKNCNNSTIAVEEKNANWRKYWLERNDNDKLIQEYKKLLQEDLKSEDDKVIDYEQNIKNDTKNVIIKSKKSTNKSKTKSKMLKPLRNKTTLQNGWLVEELDPVSKKSIDDIFDDREEIIKENLSKKLEIINKKSKELKSAKQKKVKRLKKSPDALKNLKDLTFKNQAKRPIIDEELINDPDEKIGTNEKTKETLEKIRNLEENNLKENNVSKEQNVSTFLSDAIDPNKLAVVKLKQHKGGYSTVNETIDCVGEDEDALDTDGEEQMTIAQAFEDDDIVADFNKDKADNSEIKDTEMQLFMPGWGSWAGAGISREKTENRKKRLLLKLAPKEKRRDDNKDGVYINEEASKQLRNHLVSDIPFPFTSLKDYEDSIRAPLGRNFVTETSFRLLTRPAVITQKGKIIEPMDETELLKPQRKLRNPVDIRISKLSL